MRAIIAFVRKMIIPITLLLMIVGLIAVINLQIGPANGNTTPLSQTTHQACVPTPTAIPLHPNSNPSTSLTPNASADWNSPTPTFISSSGESWSISKITDLAINSPEIDKTYVYVMHCDGSIELFKVIAGGRISDSVPLKQDDYILLEVPPASLMGRQPPGGQTPITNSSETKTPLMSGYPPPPTSIPTTQNTP